MKKKISILLAAILLVMVVPFTSMAAGPGLIVDGTYVSLSGSSESGNGWTYSDGVLTLENYSGDGIEVMGSPETTITIVIKGENNINKANGRSAIFVRASNLIFKGDGQLNVTATLYDISRGYNSSGVIVCAGTGNVTFALDQGGIITMKGTYTPDMSPKEEVFSGNMEAGILVFDYNFIYNSTVTTAGENRIILQNDNRISTPTSGETGVVTRLVRVFVPETLAEEGQGNTAGEVVGQPLGVEEIRCSMATILGEDGVTPASTVVIEGPALPAEEPLTPDPTKAEPTTPEAGTVTPVATKESPKTGDESLVGLAALLLAMSSVTIGAAVKRRQD